MSKKSPFDYVKSVNEKQYMGDDLSGYVPFLTNRAFAMHMDTILFAEEMNQAHRLGPELQYDFYYHAIRKGKRFGFPKKPDETENLDVVMEYFQYSREKALEALNILTKDDIIHIKKSLERGGR